MGYVDEPSPRLEMDIDDLRFPEVVDAPPRPFEKLTTPQLESEVEMEKGPDESIVQRLRDSLRRPSPTSEPRSPHSPVKGDSKRSRRQQETSGRNVTNYEPEEEEESQVYYAPKKHRIVEVVVRSSLPVAPNKPVSRDEWNEMKASALPLKP
jgi:hypothetical protein